MSSFTTKNFIPEATKDLYIKGHGIFCPYCNGKDLSRNIIGIEPSFNRLKQKVSCLNPLCKKSWIDIYHYFMRENLIDIEIE